MTGLVPRRVLPVLMYHRVGITTSGDPNLWISEEALARQLAWLTEGGYRTLSLDEAYDYLQSRRAPRRAVLLTFDDAFAETVERAGNILRRAGMRGALFVPVQLMGRWFELGHPRRGVASTTAGRIVNRDQLHTWSEQGFDVGSHSLSHPDLTHCPLEEVRRQVWESKQRLEEILTSPVEDFCYPYTLHDPRTRGEVAAAGYRAAYAGEPPIADLFAIPRMMVYPHDSEGRFRRKLSGYYYWLSAWHRRLLRLSGRKSSGTS